MLMSKFIDILEYSLSNFRLFVYPFLPNCLGKIPKYYINRNITQLRLRNVQYELTKKTADILNNFMNKYYLCVKKNMFSENHSIYLKLTLVFLCTRPSLHPYENIFHKI